MKRLLFLLLLPSLALAEPWDRADIALETAYTLFTVKDWRQTQDIQRHPNLQETNPILGEHPSNAKINLYFVGMGILQWYIVDALPSAQRKAWITAGLLLEVKVTKKNTSLGLSTSF